MNLNKCFDCNKRSVCKFFDQSDPRGIDGNCKWYNKQMTTEKKEHKAPEPVVHHSVPTKLNPNVNAEEIQIGDMLYRIVYTTRPGQHGYFVRTVKAKEHNIDLYRAEYGELVFRDKQSAEEVAKIHLFTGESNKK